MITEENFKLEYYDSLAFALDNCLPVDNFRYEKDYSLDSLSRIKTFFKEHEGFMATLQYDTGRKLTEPILGCILSIYPNGIVFTSRCYDPDGNFRQFLEYFVSYTDVYCHAAHVKIFGDI